MALSYVGKMDWRFSPSAHLAFYADLFYKSEFVRLKTTLISKVALYVHATHSTFISALTFFYTFPNSACNSIVFPVSNLSWGCFTAKLRAVSASGKAKPQWVAAENLPLLPCNREYFPRQPCLYALRLLLIAVKNSLEGRKQTEMRDRINKFTRP